METVYLQGGRFRRLLRLFAAALRPARGRAAEAEEALAVRLLDDYGNAVLRLAYSYLHNLHDAEEILQDTLMKYLERHPAFQSAGHEKAWLLRVAANLCKNRLDYNRLRRTDGEEDLSFVWEAVKSLPEPYRAAIHLYYYEGYSTREAARILGRAESSVRSDLRRGREKLKKILKEVFDFA